MAGKKLVADILQGLREAKAYQRGEIVPGARVHVPPEMDAKSIRAHTGLTQKEFAASIGVSLETLRNWEQKKRHPEGPARVLLALLHRNPSIVAETLGKTNAGVAKTSRKTMAKRTARSLPTQKPGSKTRTAARA